MIKLSIIIPSYNEEKTIIQILEQIIGVFKNISVEIIIVNDSSKDQTKNLVENFIKDKSFIRLLNNEKNLGKTQSVRKGILASTGELIIIQDADLEYDPKDILSMLELVEKGNYDVIYGNRFGKNNKVIYWQNYFGNLTLSAISNLFTFPRIGVWITDMEVCYKLVNGRILREIAQNIVSTSNFGFEPEITAKLSRFKNPNGKHLNFSSIPISYYPRTIAEGKKILAVKDGIKALIEIIRFNLF